MIFPFLPPGKSESLGFVQGFGKKQKTKPPLTKKTLLFCSGILQKEKLKIIEISHLKLFRVQRILQVPDSQTPKFG